ncbi:MAG: hypothetical protein AB1752_09505 [Candidatus Zixiibacteriota bacterium]
MTKTQPTPAGMPRRKPSPTARLPLVAAIAVILAMAAECPAVVTPDIAVSLSRQSATVGDPVDLTIQVRYDSALQLIVPVFGPTFGELEVLGDTTLAEGKVENGRRTYSRRVRLAAFKPGPLWTPPVQGELVDSTGAAIPWQSDSLLLDVTSVIGETSPDSLDIKALKAQYEIPESRWLFWAISGLLLGIIALAWWWWRRRQVPVSVKADVPGAPSWEIALSALQELPADVDPEQDGGRQWYFRLSEILRRYLDDRFSWTSMDETTSEILRRLPQAPFDKGLRERAREFFLLADQVRYARSPARSGRPEVDRIWVRDFVEATIPAPTIDVSAAVDAQSPPAETSERTGVAA